MSIDFCFCVVVHTDSLGWLKDTDFLVTEPEIQIVDAKSNDSDVESERIRRHPEQQAVFHCRAASGAPVEVGGGLGFQLA